MWAMQPSMIGAPEDPSWWGTPSNLLSERRLKRYDIRSWSSARTLKAKPQPAWKAPRLGARRCRQTSTSGGSSDTEVNELAVKPRSSPSGSRVVTTVTPVVNEPAARLKSSTLIWAAASASGPAALVRESGCSVSNCPTSRVILPKTQYQLGTTQRLAHGTVRRQGAVATDGASRQPHGPVGRPRPHPAVDAGRRRGRPRRGGGVRAARRRPEH